MSESDLLHRDFERCYRAIESRDARFDGWWVAAVRSTRVYCRPSCPARTPMRRNVTFFATAAAAQRAGYRACKRCRPDASPGAPEWSARADTAGRAMRLIADGVVDREGVPGLARRLSFSERHLHRLLVAEVGAGPLALARAHRAQTARMLIETSDLPFGDVAYAAGFGSARQFNQTVRDVFGASPTELRARRRRAAERVSGELTVRLPVRTPFAADALARYFADRAIPQVERVDGRIIRRAIALPSGGGIIELELHDDGVVARLRLDDMHDVHPAVNRCRRLLDLDADPEAVDAALGADPLLGPSVARTPGLRSPGAADSGEVLVRSIVGQQISAAGARTVLGRLAERYGDPVEDHALGRSFPSLAAIAEVDADDLPMPAARGRALRNAAAAVSRGDITLDAGADRRETARALLALPGIGPWTVSYVMMRAFGDPDVFMACDLGIRRALTARGADARVSSATALGKRWRPWRSYATHHLWHIGPPEPRRVRDTAKPAGPSPSEVARAASGQGTQ